MFDPVKASANIKEEFISYISTAFSFSDYHLRKQFEEQLNEIVAKGPYLETNDVFVRGKSISELISDGLLSRLFVDLEAHIGDVDTTKERKHMLEYAPAFFARHKDIFLLATN